MWQIAPGRLVAVAGASGSGKSSVVRAGVLPRLRRNGGARSQWTVLEMTPGTKPFRALASAVLSDLQPELVGLARVDAAQSLDPRLRDTMAADFLSWEELTGELGRARGAGHQTPLFVDQFEELFSLAS